MRVLAPTDVLATKLLALKEHEVDYDSVLEIARALREQIDWDVLRASGRRASPYAKAFFTLVDELGVAPRRRPRSMRVVVVGATGNVGTSLAARARRRRRGRLGARARAPAAGAATAPKVEWAAADIVRDDLVPHFRGADVRRPPRVADPALARPRQALAHERPRLDARLRRGRRRGRAGARLRVVGRRVLARPEGPPRRRELADRRHRDELLLAAEGRGRAAARRASSEAHPDVRVVRLRPGLIFKREVGDGAAAPLRRAAAPDAAARGPGGSRSSRTRRGCVFQAVALRRRRRGVPARGRRRRARRVQRRRRARASTPDELARLLRAPQAAGPERRASRRCRS